ncbi:MAG: hypothetical protein AAF439_10105 [Pseudomonadota bacterium]
MSVGEAVSLEAFVAEAIGDGTPQRDQHIAAIRDGAIDVLGHLGEDPDLSAQMQRLLSAVPGDLDDEGVDTAARSAKTVLEDLRQKWTDAEDPPLVDQIDDRLAAFRKHIEGLVAPGPSAMTEAARKIDRLGEVGQRMEGIDARFRNWALGAGVLFLIGLALFFDPRLGAGLPLSPMLIALLFIGALPVVAVIYALRVMPRSRADNEIDALNRTHFLPYGGIYFPAGDAPARVIRVDWTPPPEPKHKDPRKAQERAGRSW